MRGFLRIDILKFYWLTPGKCVESQILEPVEAHHYLVVWVALLAHLLKP